MYLGKTTKLFSKVHVLLHTYFPEQYTSCMTSHCQQHLLMQQGSGIILWF